ncbi:hypothetical protein CHS0354_036995 [Potamilus streckersoni]|uniref:t-SNARE coiled-coil homology domain-containing protein n=1 Tax=Potamilus streckersoni TaxID=2493646 RepID=A0AAE0SKL5_9BIVA|nr:hypothetical protein CHS0354_036995 [Potamilus streckersoni]
MASFEEDDQEEVQFLKYPIRRLDLSINKFMKVIQIDLQRLHQHKLNIEKHKKLADWSSLTSENVNTLRTIQQIKANVREIEKARKQVCDEDLEKFDKKIDGMKTSAIQAVMEFVDINENQKDVTDAKTGSALQGQPLLGNDLGLVVPPNMQMPARNTSQELIIFPQENAEALESYEQLQESLIELNTMIHEFSSTVEAQQEKIDRIEDNLEKAHESVQSGIFNLGSAAKFKAAVIPIAGAAIGTVVAGPFGLLVGAKVGAVLGAVGGGTVGFLGGRLVKKRQDNITEMELKNMKQKRSFSMPDVAPEETTGSPEVSSSWFEWRRKTKSTSEELEREDTETDST